MVDEDAHELPELYYLSEIGGVVHHEYFDGPLRSLELEPELLFEGLQERRSIFVSRFITPGRVNNNLPKTETDDPRRLAVEFYS